MLVMVKSKQESLMMYDWLFPSNFLISNLISPISLFFQKKLTNSTKLYALKSILPAHSGQDLSDTNFNDNTQLIYLHAASLLKNLRLRYDKNIIYVWFFFFFKRKTS